MPPSTRFQDQFERWSKMCKLGSEAVAAADCSALSFAPAASGALNLSFQLHATDQFLHFLHSPEDPVQEAREWFARLILKNVDTLYIYGIGLGYYYEACKDWLHAQASRSVVFLEDRAAVIHRFLETEQAAALLDDRQGALYLFSETDPAFYRLDKIAYLYASAHPTECFISTLQSYQQFQPEACHAVTSKLSFFHALYKSGLSESINVRTPFFRNFFWNYLYLPDSFYMARMQNRFAGIPAIICGAGPSLEKNIQVLRTLGDRALIFAGGTALNALNVKGVMPHFGIGIDPNPAQFTRAVINQGYELPFFYRTRMLHEALEIMHGDKLYVPGNAGYLVGSWMEQKLGIASSIEISEGFNVLNFSVGVAHLLGCNPIICVGIDLAYTDGRSYPTGLIAHPIHDQKTVFQTKAFEEDLISKPDIYGKQVLTLWKWVAESLWYTNYAGQHPDLALINSSEGGIGFSFIPNIPLALLKERELLKQYDFDTLIHGTIQNSAFPANVNEAQIKELMQELQKSLKNCDKLAGQLADLLKQGGKDAEVEEIKRKFQEEEGFKAILKPFYENFQKSSELERMRTAMHTPNSTGNGLDAAHYLELQTASKVQGELIDKIIEYFETSKLMAAKWQEKNSATLQQLRLQYPSPSLQPDEVYHFENGVLTLIDRELHLNQQVAFAPDPKKEIERIYYSSGALQTESYYKEGSLHGPSSFYAENGTLLARSWYLEGKKEGKAWTYYPDGAVHSLQRYRQGKRQGRQLTFYRDGLPKSSLGYTDGVLDGVLLLYHPEGFLQRKLQYHRGKRTGKEQIWDMRHVLRIEAYFKDDQPVESARIWHYNGVLAKEIWYDANSNPLSVKQWDEYGMEIAPTSEAQEDYFMHLSKETEKLTSSLHSMVGRVAEAVPIYSLQKEQAVNLASELDDLRKEAERLQLLGQRLREMAGANSGLQEEAIWKSQKIQYEMEKQLETLTAAMNKKMQLLDTGLRNLMERIKNDDR